jgi:hypothetical protein
MASINSTCRSKRKIAALDQLSDKLQTSRERIAEPESEIAQVKSDADSLERTKRVSRLTALNSSKELAQADGSKIVAAIVTAKARILASGRAVRNLNNRRIDSLYPESFSCKK